MGVDRWLLQFFDALVLWFWDRFELPKVWMQRPLAVLWLVGAVFQAFHKAAWRVGAEFAWTGLVVFSMVYLMETETKMTPRNQNARVMQRRYSRFQAACRLLIVITTPLAIGEPWYIVSSIVAMTVFVFVTDALVPMEPPRKKIRLVAPAPAEFSTMRARG